MRVAVVIVGLLAAAGWAKAGEPASGLEPERSHLELGTVTSGSTISATFVLHNRGKSPVRILRAAPS